LTINLHPKTLKTIEPSSTINLRTIKYRLANDFQLAIITFLGTIVLVGITPFAVLRGLNGQWESFAIDLFIQCGILGSMLRAWITGDAHGPSIFLGYFIGIVATTAVYILGTAGIYWFYPAIVANFFLVDRRRALAIALISLATSLIGGGIAASRADAASFSVTVIVIALLTYAFAYRTAIQRMQLETLATKDALTGALNRRSLLDELERARKAVLREHRSYGILVLDLDLFKGINDQHGHAAGDHVLIEFTHLLEKHIRKDDRLFRYGGEEFVVLVQQISPQFLQSMAEHLRAITEQEIHTPNGKPVTTSIGGALLQPEEAVEAWFARADAALYAAKNAGRNRVLIASGNEQNTDKNAI
jgi:diguanylate cyclase (GGDEF)-like protein